MRVETLEGSSSTLPSRHVATRHKVPVGGRSLNRSDSFPIAFRNRQVKNIERNSRLTCPKIDRFETSLFFPAPPRPASAPARCGSSVAVLRLFDDLADCEVTLLHGRVSPQGILMPAEREEWSAIPEARTIVISRPCLLTLLIDSRRGQKKEGGGFRTESGQ